MIHRAPFGSLERFIGVLIEHYAGKFPFWLAPVQAIVLPLSEHYMEYAQQVQQRLDGLGFRVELDSRSEKLGYKIREAEMQKIPYMLIVGAKEQEAESASVRVHGEGDKGMQSLDEIIADFYDLNNVEKLAAKAHQEAAIEIKHHEAIEHAVPDARE